MHVGSAFLTLRIFTDMHACMQTVAACAVTKTQELVHMFSCLSHRWRVCSKFVEKLRACMHMHTDMHIYIHRYMAYTHAWIQSCIVRDLHSKLNIGGCGVHVCPCTVLNAWCLICLCYRLLGVNTPTHACMAKHLTTFGRFAQQQGPRKTLLRPRIRAKQDIRSPCIRLIHTCSKKASFNVHVYPQSKKARWWFVDALAFINRNRFYELRSPNPTGAVCTSSKPNQALTDTGSTLRNSNHTVMSSLDRIAQSKILDKKEYQDSFCFWVRIFLMQSYLALRWFRPLIAWSHRCCCVLSTGEGIPLSYLRYSILSFCLMSPKTWVAELLQVSFRLQGTADCEVIFSQYCVCFGLKFYLHLPATVL